VRAHATIAEPKPSPPHRRFTTPRAASTASLPETIRQNAGVVIPPAMFTMPSTFRPTTVHLMSRRQHHGKKSHESAVCGGKQKELARAGREMQRHTGSKNMRGGGSAQAGKMR